MTKLANLYKSLFILGAVLFFDAFIYEPYSLKTKVYHISDSQIKNIKIVFATDFHIAPYKWEKWRLQKIIKTINDQNADLVILGGDYVNGHSKKSTLSPHDTVSFLQQIKAPKAAVLGNHDSYYDKEEVKKCLKAVNIPVLDNENIKLNLRGIDVYIAGVSDYDTDNPDVKKALQNTASPLIFVTHSPDVFAENDIPADISLAGHTHGGQAVLPFLGALIVNIKSGRKFTYGLVHKNGKPMIISSGLGTSVIPARFNNLPEIVVINFK